jgi:hypothetical protein
MPRPFNERQALEQERAELPEQIAAYQQELDITPIQPGAPGDAGVADPAGRLAEIAARPAALKAEH